MDNLYTVDNVGACYRRENGAGPLNLVNKSRKDQLDFFCSEIAGDVVFGSLVFLGLDFAGLTANF